MSGKCCRILLLGLAAARSLGSNRHNGWLSRESPVGPSTITNPAAVRRDTPLTMFAGADPSMRASGHVTLTFPCLAGVVALSV